MQTSSFTYFIYDLADEKKNNKYEIGIKSQKQRWQVEDAGRENSERKMAEMTPFANVCLALILHAYVSCRYISQLIGRQRDVCVILAPKLTQKQKRRNSDTALRCLLEFSIQKT